MSAELFFIYDSHCPWSYVTTRLVNAINNAYPKMPIHLMHCGYFDGESTVSRQTISQVEALSNTTFSKKYLASIDDKKDSTLTANLLAWVQRTAANSALSLLNTLQQAHFEQAKSLTDKDDVAELIKQLKLSPPAKALQSEKFTKDAEYALHDVEELQEIIQTTAIPALLLAHDEQLVLLNHNLYLAQPEKIVEAVALELAK